ncbi:hypothetical protein BDY17DRAFT_323573 [Neohortaea acidophila]|uniref:Apple domain-containing protein n=1 Tax=Neohortaea acidophila TaxID=245834 RepID=A0A6A6PYA1_9PEZI|nr:uncharacterized protein BDY17DRAFT_323573 [Neohortaea acidophila]KAF2484741.1 hypothetical protein BDY17DRAFT_323573 [Neohortaea acidophila]
MLILHLLFGLLALTTFSNARRHHHGKHRSHQDNREQTEDRIAAAAGTMTSSTVIPNPTTPTSTYPYSDPGVTLASADSYTHTMHTPPATWTAPTFSTPTPIPSCAGDLETGICAGGAGSQGLCLDFAGLVYGILCEMELSGVVITSDGKKMKEKRTFTGSLENCLDFCDEFGPDECIGVGFAGGECEAYAKITGSYAGSSGGYAALRQ